MGRIIILKLSQSWHFMNICSKEYLPRFIANLYPYLTILIYYKEPLEEFSISVILGGEKNNYSKPFSRGQQTTAQKPNPSPPPVFIGQQIKNYFFTFLNS